MSCLEAKTQDIKVLVSTLTALLDRTPSGRKRSKQARFLTIQVMDCAVKAIQNPSPAPKFQGQPQLSQYHVLATSCSFLT